MKTNENTPLTKHDLFRANWRWLWASQLSWNYEKNDGTGLFLHGPTISTTILPTR